MGGVGVGGGGKSLSVISTIVRYYSINTIMSIYKNVI